MRSGADMAQVRKEHGSDYSADPAFWLRVFDASRAYAKAHGEAA